MPARGEHGLFIPTNGQPPVPYKPHYSKKLELLEEIFDGRTERTWGEVIYELGRHVPAGRAVRRAEHARDVMTQRRRAMGRKPANGGPRTGNDVQVGRNAIARDMLTVFRRNGYVDYEIGPRPGRNDPRRIVRLLPKFHEIRGEQMKDARRLTAV